MNRRIADIPPSLIRSINARKKAGDIDLGLGEPTLPPDLDAFEGAMEWTRRHGSPYSPNAGFPDLRAAIAAYLGGAGEWIGGEPQAENVCVSVGSEEALYLAIKTVVDPEVDEVLIVEPCYLAYPKICMLEGIRHRMVPLDGSDHFRARAAKVLASVSPETRLVVINTPSNPTGQVWPDEELAALGAGLRERPGRPVYVLSDEVYREIFFGGDRPGSIAAYYKESLVAGSLSKSNALTGLRLGWLAGPTDVVAAATTVHQFVNTAASTFSQRVATELLSSPERLGLHRDRYAASRERLLVAAEEHEVELIPPEGAFYALVRLRGPTAGDSVRAAQQLLEDRRVVAVPGRAFGNSAEGWLRISWVGSPETIEEGIRRIGDWLSETG